MTISAYYYCVSILPYFLLVLLFVCRSIAEEAEKGSTAAAIVQYQQKCQVSLLSFVSILSILLFLVGNSGFWMHLCYLCGVDRFGIEKRRHP